jgi:hypothetical protein
MYEEPLIIWEGVGEEVAKKRGSLLGNVVRVKDDHIL